MSLVWTEPPVVMFLGAAVLAISTLATRVGVRFHGGAFLAVFSCMTAKVGKGRKDRVTMMPERLVKPLTAHLDKMKGLHGADLAAGGGWVAVPDALRETSEGVPGFRQIS